MSLADGIENLDSSEGVQQGDVLSIWFYSMAIYTSCKKIETSLVMQDLHPCRSWFELRDNSYAS